MISIAQCLTLQHDLRLVFLAAIVCAVGSWITFRLFERALREATLIALGWQFLAATAAGSSIWTTHFIAMLAYQVDAPVTYDPVLTIVSLLIAICGTFVGFSLVSVSRNFGFIPGALAVGAAMSAMHYGGMAGYHVSGLVSWDMRYVVASVVVAMIASLAAFWVVTRGNARHRVFKAAGIFVLGVVGLHFTGMTAMQVTPLVLRGTTEQNASYLAMALSIAVACFVMAGTGLTSFLMDSRSRQESMRKLHTLAFFDGLTGLGNRQYLRKKLTEVSSRASQEGKSFAFVGMDLDKFKEVNDLHGHAAGDYVLSVVGERLKEMESNTLHFARLGGDEFAAIVEISGKTDLFDLMLDIKRTVSEPILFEEVNELSIGVSLGVSRYPEDATTTQELVHCADLAMYRAKADPLTTVCFYDAAMDQAVHQRKALTADLRQALSRDQLELYYQVQTSVASGEVSGYEVLLRWKHPTLGFVSPVDFIPLAESSGSIMEIGMWVLNTACHQAAQWPNEHRIAVNLSPVQFADPSLPEMVKAALDDSGLAPHRLELELTESTIVENRDRTLELISRIRALGVTIALDDFGTGYSSLDTLRSFPFDKIKLDRSFMSEIEDSVQARAIVRAVLAMGRSLNVPVLAEGVETKNQLDILNSEGCDNAQGYLLGRPVPLVNLLANFNTVTEITNHNVLSLEAVLDAAQSTEGDMEPVRLVSGSGSMGS